MLLTKLLLTYLLTPWCRVLLEQLPDLQLVKKFPAFHGTRKFTTALKSVRHLSLSWASPIQSTFPHPPSWRSILILSTHLHLGLSSGLFPSGFPHQDTIQPPLLTHTRHMPSPSHSSPFYHPHNIGWAVQNIYLLVMQSPPFPLVPREWVSTVHCAPWSEWVSKYVSEQKVKQKIRNSGKNPLGKKLFRISQIFSFPFHN